MPHRVLTAIRTMRIARVAAAKSHRGSQGFELMSFSEEQKVINKMWARMKMPTGEHSHKLLTPRAVEVIQAAIKSGEYDDRINANEPPFMAPDPDPAKYSPWCSFCNDFAEHLVLCAGCRVGLCVVTPTSPIGCLDWDPILDDPCFVYYCPYCSGGHGSLKLLRKKKEKIEVFFRYDSPVLIISSTWRETTQPYGKHLRDLFLRKYTGSENMVMLMEVALDIAAARAEEKAAKKKAAKKAAGKGKTAEVDDDDGGMVQTSTSQAAVDFLAEFATAKIVVVIDTHSLENGSFSWSVESPNEGSSLLEILHDCIPAEIFAYISDGVNTPLHKHKCLILNLSCGPSVSIPVRRNELLEGHCADAVLSFANRVTIVGDIASGVGEFVTRWVQTPSDYDTLIATTVSKEWIENYYPVFSRKVDGIPIHTTYSAFSLLRPYGKIVMCHQMCGENTIRARDNKKQHRVDLRCLKCDSRCKVPKTLPDARTVLGAKLIFKSPYPPELFPAEWKLSPKANLDPGPSGSSSSLHPPTIVARSSSLPGSTTSSTPTPSLPGLRAPSRTRSRGRGLSRPRSAPGIRGSLSISPAPSPASPHEPSPGPSASDHSDRRRSLAPGSYSAEKGGKNREQKRS